MLLVSVGSMLAVNISVVTRTEGCRWGSGYVMISSTLPPPRSVSLRAASCMTNRGEEMASRGTWQQVTFKNTAYEVCIDIKAELHYARSCLLDETYSTCTGWILTPLTPAPPMLLRLNADAFGHLLVGCFGISNSARRGKDQQTYLRPRQTARPPGHNPISRRRESRIPIVSSCLAQRDSFCLVLFVLAYLICSPHRGKYHGNSPGNDI